MEQGVLIAWILALVAVDHHSFLVFVLPAWALGIAIFVSLNLLQHDGCIPDSELLHSRNFLNRVENWIFFNGGYHTMHHVQPTLHWSQLPAAHNKLVAPWLPTELACGSYLYHLFVLYLMAKEPIPGVNPQKI